ncbi:TonB family protein [Vulgatibacter sp.]|uniref:TonB family protein n=1 Tax=Vulgatibacter sp. TaxID=1971226 RepID=UPI0035628B6C
MALKHRVHALAVIGVLLAGGVASASVPQRRMVPVAGDEPPASTQQQPAEAQPTTDELELPKPVGPMEVPYPVDAPALEAPVEVEVQLLIDEQGAVQQVTLLRSAGAPWDEAVLAACKAFRFEPARWKGVPAAVEIPFVQRFEPAVQEAPADDEAEALLDASLGGEVIEMGTRNIVPAATVIATVEGERFTVEADEAGRFSLPLRAGAAEVEVQVPGYKRFLVKETIAPGQALQVRYLVERVSYNPFEQLVIGKALRQEVTRTTLRDREIRRVPGTFGDPFRVIGTMPGVGQMFSLLDYPIIRGASPGSSGILLDGDRIPQLFHFLAGPAVIHPEFIDSVDFYPGAFPIAYGGYTGGIVDGITRSGLPDERRIELSADLLNTSAFVRQPILGATGTIAGRYGYPAMLLSAFSEDTYAGYWDYQGRLDGRAGDGRWTVFAFGSFDEVGEVRDGEEQIGLQSIFHRLSLRWIDGDDAAFDRYQLTFGLDQVRTGDEEEVDEGRASEPPQFATWMIHPRASWRRPLVKDLAVHGGVDFSWRRSEIPGLATSEDDEIYIPPTWQAQAGAFVETPWWITEDFLLTPGVRFDVWENADVRRASVDPRLNWRWRLQQEETHQLWLKGGVGIFHQPPRPPVPVPVLGDLLLTAGMPAALQTTLGTELDLASGYFVDLQTYFNYMDPIYLDLEINGSVLEEVDGSDTRNDYDVLDPFTGRSYGAEILLRKRDQGNLFGWVSYTLSRSERLARDGWKAFDFDRTHMLQLVAGLKLPRDWEIGARFQAISGRPVSPYGASIERADAFTRFDLRIDKRAVYRSWMLDFYVELINTMISREQVGENSRDSVPYIFPTVGFRAVL